jgi:transcriptional antiterminator NusG
MKRWYIVQILTGSEEKIKTDLEARIVEGKLSESFGRILIPESSSVGLEAEKEKIFPGYLVVEMEMSSDTKRLVLETNRISKFLGGSDPAPLSDQEVGRIFEQISGKLKIKSEGNVFSVGSEVHIISGPFDGFVGVVEEINEEREKVKVMVSIFGRMTAIELGFDQVKR